MKAKIETTEELRNIIVGANNIMDEKDYEIFCKTFNDKYDYSSITNMSWLFYGCENLTKIPPLNTENVTNMNGMFSECKNLEEIPYMDTKNVTNMENMFFGCKKLKSIPALNTSNVTNMEYMFNMCSDLVELPQFDIKKGCNCKNNLSNTPLINEKNNINNISDYMNIKYIIPEKKAKLLKLKEENDKKNQEKINEYNKNQWL